MAVSRLNANKTRYFPISLCMSFLDGPCQTRTARNLRDKVDHTLTSKSSHLMQSNHRHSPMLSWRPLSRNSVPRPPAIGPIDRSLRSVVFMEPKRVRNLFPNHFDVYKSCSDRIQTVYFLDKVGDEGQNLARNAYHQVCLPAVTNSIQDAGLARHARSYIRVPRTMKGQVSAARDKNRLPI